MNNLQIIDLYSEEAIDWKNQNKEYTAYREYQPATDLMMIRISYGSDYPINRFFHSQHYKDLGSNGFIEQLDDIKASVDRKRGIGREIYPEDDYNYATMTKKELWADEEYEPKGIDNRGRGDNFGKHNYM